jgi:hypothetical protein
VEFARDLLVSSDAHITLLVVVTPMDCDYFMERTAPVCDVDAIAKAKSAPPPRSSRKRGSTTA